MSVIQLPKDKWTKDGKKWAFVAWYVDINGNPKLHRSNFFLTKQEARKNEQLFLFKANSNYTNFTNITFKELYLRYFEFIKNKVKATTIKTYKSRIKYLYMLNKIKVSDLNITHFEKWRKKLLALDISNKYRNNLFKLFKSILNFGMKWYGLTFNNIYPKLYNFTDPNEIKKEINFLTYDEFNKFISKENDLVFKCFFETLYYCGLRKGEARALTWKDIDLKNKEIYITKGLSDNIDGKSYIITSPKTKSSIRKLPIPHELYTLFSNLYKLRKKNEYFSKNWFVFGTYKPLSDDIIRRRKNLICKKAKIKQIRIHDFRHSCASLLINNGANITIVAKYLGHSKVNETLNTYSHMYKNQLNHIVNIIDNLQKKK